LQGRAPATQALMALTALQNFAPFPVCHRASKVFVWISNGLREFWDKATVLKLAAVACCKQYCLRGQSVKKLPGGQF